jgi:FkbM family methyltransferase
MTGQINNFTVLESAYGRFVVNRHAAAQAEALLKTGRTHFEPELQRILAIARTLPGQAMALEAGANIGMVAVPLAHTLQGSGGTVIAFEAQRMLCYAMCGTAALNDLDNLQVFNQALGAATSWLNVPRQDYGAAQDFGALSLVGGDPAAPGEHVLLSHIDGLDLPRLDFLKVDVQGMELEVLKGGDAAIRAHQPWCWIACRKVGMEPVKAAFAGLSYRFFRMNDSDLLCAPAGRLEESKLKISAPET